VIWFIGAELFVAIVLAAITASTVKLPIFWVIQFVNAQLLVLGLFICLWPAFAKCTWLWWNDDDGAVGKTYWERYYWLAIRNPVDNFKHVRWTQRSYGPLFYKTWIRQGKMYYAKVGWMDNTFCCMSAGSGRGW